MPLHPAATSADTSVREGNVMRVALVPLLGATITIGAGACSSAPAIQDPGGEATVTIADKTFKVNKVKLSYETGEGSYFRIEGDDADHADEDCLPGLSGGLALYGDLPGGVTIGRRPERARTAIRVHRRWRRSQPLLRRLERAARRGTGHRALHGGRPHRGVVLVLRQLHPLRRLRRTIAPRRSAPRAAGPRTSKRPEDA